MSLTADDSGRFGFASGRWFEVLRSAETRQPLGRLGAYELLEEVGRGGQGVVFRARQPGTGREIALKRLLAGAFASPQTLRRFEREVEAAVALNHPGIVTVYGVDLVEGAPLLTMEWVEGEAVTRWAAERPRAEVLAVFLLVCDAVHHAHQRGVLHRDLKPSNVVVDVTGRPRVLDFGLAKLASDTRASITSSADFLGTPAYAAPEQWRGEELDVRADVYSLGALLFEMLTGRRLIEGEGLNALVRASATVTPTRPSSLVRSIPRELDTIVLQSLASEREHRYQSVDAFSADIRRFLAGDPVLAHPPSAWYLVRKLVARDRLASGLVAALAVALIVGTSAYAVLTAHQADRLTEERDRALQAGEAEKRARLEAETQGRRAREEQQRAEAAQEEAQRERQRVKEEQENAEAVLSFLVDDVIGAVDPDFVGHEPKLLEILRAAAPKVDERFQDNARASDRVHTMLALALLGLGSYAEAEAEMRPVLERRRNDPGATPDEIAEDAFVLGRILYNTGQYDESESLLREAAGIYEASVPLEGEKLGTALGDLVGLLLLDGRTAEALRTQERALELLSGEANRLAARGNHALILQMLGRMDEARAEYEALISELDVIEGEPASYQAEILFNLAALYEDAGELEKASATFRRALGIMTEVFGSDHPRSAPSMGRLAKNMVARGEDLEEAEQLARRGLDAVLRAGGDDLGVEEQRRWLAAVLEKRGDPGQAAVQYAEALPLIARHHGKEHKDWLACAQRLFLALSASGKCDEAKAVLDEIEANATPAGRGWAKRQRALALRKKGDHEGAVQLYEEVIALLTPLPSEKASLAAALSDYAETLRSLGDTAGAEELERQAAELRD